MSLVLRLYQHNQHIASLVPCNEDETMYDLCRPNGVVEYHDFPFDIVDTLIRCGFSRQIGESTEKELQEDDF